MTMKIQKLQDHNLTPAEDRIPERKLPHLATSEHCSVMHGGRWMANTECCWLSVRTRSAL